LSAAAFGGLAGVLMHRPAHSKSVTQTIVGAHYLRRGLLIRPEVPGGSPEQKQADS
jgi:hypothetical protein